MACGSIISWQIDGEKVETVADNIFFSSKITADSDCSHNKRCLLLGRKAMINLDSVLKSRDSTLPTKVPPVKAVVFPVIRYKCESWTLNKTECLRTDAFELWCWWRLLWVPLTARRSNQSILKEINPEYSLGKLMLKLKLQYFGHMIQRANSLKKTLIWERLKAGGEEGSDSGWDGWMASLPQWTWSEVKVTQSCPALCDPMDYTVRGILQARILEWVAFSFSRGSSQTRDQTQVSCIAGGFFTSWATREARSMDVSLSTFWAIVKDREAWRAAIHRASESWTLT